MDTDPDMDEAMDPDRHPRPVDPAIFSGCIRIGYIIRLFRILQGRSGPAFPLGDHAPVLENQHERPPCQCGAPKVRIIFSKDINIGSSINSSLFSIVKQ
jgi:hypothetical protein